MSVDPKASYYDHGGIETVEILRAKLTAEEFRGWVKGELLTHVCRMPWKGDEVRDAEKAATYAAWLLDEMMPPPAERQEQVRERYSYQDDVQPDSLMQDDQRPPDRHSTAHCPDGGPCKHKCGLEPCKVADA